VIGLVELTWALKGLPTASRVHNPSASAPDESARRPAILERFCAFAAIIVQLRDRLDHVPAAICARQEPADRMLQRPMRRRFRSLTPRRFLSSTSGALERVVTSQK
jgi:hypothetical protein